MEFEVPKMELMYSGSKPSSGEGGEATAGKGGGKSGSEVRLRGVGEEKFEDDVIFVVLSETLKGGDPWSKERTIFKHSKSALCVCHHDSMTNTASCN